jgi:hypothetical protein
MGFEQRFESKTTQKEGMTYDGILQDILQYGVRTLQMYVFFNVTPH